MVVKQRTFPLEFAMLATAIYLCGIYVARLVPGADAPRLLAFGITADLAILVPLLYYWLAVRRRGWPAFSVVPIFVLSLFGASRIVPAEHHQLLEGLKHSLVVLELGIFGFVAWTLRRALAQGRNLGDRLEGFRSVLTTLMPPRPAAAAAYELATLTYALAPRQRISGEHAFTYHVKGATGAITFAFLLAVVAESIPVHVLLSRWSVVAAGIHLLLSVYGALWLIGDSRAMAQRPIEVSDDGLTLRLGLRWTLEVPSEDIAELSSFRGSAKRSKTTLDLVPMGSMSSHRLRLRRPLAAQGIYGFTKKVEEVVFCVDEVERFEAVRSLKSI